MGQWNLRDRSVDALPGAIRTLRSRGQVEVRPTDNTGYWIRIRKGADRDTTAELVTNTYYLPEQPLSRDQVQTIRRAGWESVGRMTTIRPAVATHRRTWPKGTRAEAIALAAREVLEGVLGVATDDIDAAAFVRDARLTDCPPFPHVIEFWDMKYDPPFESFSEAAARLIAVGAQEIHFNVPVLDGDDWEVVIAPIPLHPEVAAELWYVSLAEMPSEGGRLVAWGC